MHCYHFWKVGRQNIIFRMFNSVLAWARSEQCVLARGVCLQTLTSEFMFSPWNNYLSYRCCVFFWWLVAVEYIMLIIIGRERFILYLLLICLALILSPESHFIVAYFPSQMGTSYNFCFLTCLYEFGFWSISSLNLWVYMFPMLAVLLELANEHFSSLWCCHSIGVTKRKKFSK